jgi:hypothetical protein
VAANPDFRFLFDGQTLVIEDLLAIAPDYARRVERLIRDGRLLIGPYYCQPDWQLTGGELLIRNLMIGQQDMQQYGGVTDAGWLVDTFGHISQAPQIHRLFGIEAAFVWRGVPQLTPYFHWDSPDGSRLLAINLFGGYRNLYGVTHAPEVAVKRLLAEIEKLRPFYPTPDIPLFDGYDLEDNPEDPLAFYARTEGIGEGVALQEATPVTFAREIGRQHLSLPTIAGELNSGKYGATFPGTFSARTYLKLMAHDCERLLFRLCEPLATLAHWHGRAYQAGQYEAWARLLLQNAVHDCLCGVSIDQVHEKMEYSYRQVFDNMVEDMQTSLGVILGPFAAADYAVSLNPFPADQWQIVGDELVHVQTSGLGVWPVVEREAITDVSEPAGSFGWHNEHYTASVDTDGIVRLDDAALGRIIVSAEHGDTYSDEAGEQLGIITPASPPLIVERSRHHTVVAFEGEWRSGGAVVKTAVRLTFDQSPLLKWEIDLDSRGTNLRVDLLFETAQSGEIVAGMPFDVVQRPVADTDLLPRQLPQNLQTVLLGQRELNRVTSFPMHDFVAITNDEQMTALLAKGVHSYTATESGTIALHLRRAVEWVTEADLPGRIGDAGPFFYVPDARCERAVQHEVAVVIGLKSVTSTTFQSLLAAYQNPPLLVRHKGSGKENSWHFLQESVPMSSLHVMNGAVLARFYNPTNEKQPFTQPRLQTDVWGKPMTRLNHIPPKKIVTVQLAGTLPHIGIKEEGTAVELLTPPPWRVGPHAGLPDPAILQQLEAKIERLAAQLAQLEPRLAAATGAEQMRLQHQSYIWQREKLEFELSLLLNRRKLAEAGALRYGYLYEPDKEVATVGLALNRLRIKRRIFDYVIQAI